MDSPRKTVQDILEQINRVILGKEDAVEEILLAFLANGHVLLEDIPGVGKTTLARAFSRILSMQYKRVQFTPDVLPSDLTGFSLYRREQERFEYQPGAVFCNLLLADELNRASPKSQSALLEVMEERKVTVEGVTRDVPAPFLVVATQNPFGGAGTQRLPESQTDRFMISLALGYPDFESELAMAMSVGKGDKLDQLESILDTETLLRLQREVDEIYIKETVYRYILNLITATRTHPSVERGASPRGTIALVKMAKASAWMAGRDFVIPNDVKTQFPYVAAHRLILNAAAQMDGLSAADVLAEILAQVQQPPMEGAQ